MDIFTKKLEGIREGKPRFWGRTLYGTAAGPARPDPAAPQPFPPEEAEGRFRALRQEGLALVRLVITWEALEYAGPGAYDESYLAYLRKILVAAAQTGIFVFIDPVQNRWSRWIGGEDAPAWVPEQRDKGREWLQERYLDCMRHCFRRLKNCAALIGWGAWAEDFSKPFMLRFAGRMREAREGIGFFVAEDPGPQGEGAQPQRLMGTGDDPEWAANAFYYYDDSAFPDYQEPVTGDLAISVSR
jgi:hypothetical protein